MIEYTYQNKIYFSYNDTRFGTKCLDDKLEFTLSPCTRNPKTFKEECYEVAKTLSKKAKSLGKIPTVLLSGGLDSEVVCKSFIDQNIPFETATFKFDNNLNNHEIYYVDLFCKRHGLKTNFFNIDTISFIQSPHALELYLKTCCSQPIFLNHMMLLSHIWNTGGMPIVGMGDIELTKENGWKYCLYEYDLSVFRHAQNENIDGLMDFFLYTPEILLSMLNEKEILRATDPTNINARLLQNARLEKYKVYRRFWPDLASRPKFSGYEQVFDLYYKKKIEFDQQRKIQYDDTWSIDLEKVKKILGAQI